MAQHRELPALGEFLAANEPADARHTLLHGGPNPGNDLLDGGRVAAIGDPRPDLDSYEAVGLYKMAIVMAGWAGRGGWGYYGMDAISRRLTFLFGPRWAG